MPCLCRSQIPAGLLEKHRVADFDGLSERLEAMRTQLLDAQHRAQKLTDLQGAVKTARHTLDQTGSALHRCRQEAGDSLSKAIEGHLQHLKLSSAKIGFEWTYKKWSNGALNIWGGPTDDPKAAVPVTSFKLSPKKFCCGRTPLETLLDGKSVWAEKNLAQI